MSTGRDRLLELFDEYAAAHAAGERPEVLAYLERAGAEADAFEQLVDAYLQVAPLRPADEVEAALIEARIENEPALLVLRRRLRLRVDDVAERLLSTLGLSKMALPRLQDRYQQLEAGVLDPGRVSEKLWEALAAVFGSDVQRLARRLPGEPMKGAKAPAFARMTEKHDWVRALDAVPPGEPIGLDDERQVDRLFGIR